MSAGAQGGAGVGVTPEDATLPDVRGTDTAAPVEAASADVVSVGASGSNFGDSGNGADVHDAAQHFDDDAEADGDSSDGVDAGDTPLADSGPEVGAAGCPDVRDYANAPLPDVASSSEDSPVTGLVELYPDSTWEVASGVFQKAYEVRTPTATYFLHLASGALVSLVDPKGSTQWIQYSYGGQPDRGIPLLGGCCSPPANGNPAPLVGMKTLKDDARSSATHLHVDSASSDDKWRLSWDFYLTHATVTVEHAAAEYGFTYKGTPGGPGAALNTDLWLNGETKKSAATYVANKDLPYPEWVRFASTASNGQSLFLLQHRDDCLADSYQPRSLTTEKTAVFTFGNGKIPATRRTRVSFGLVANAEAETRISYVRDLMK